MSEVRPQKNHSDWINGEMGQFEREAFASDSSKAFFTSRNTENIYSCGGIGEMSNNEN